MKLSNIFQLKIDETIAEGRDTPPQLSPVSTVPENRVTPLPPPALEVIYQHESEKDAKHLPTQRVSQLLCLIFCQNSSRVPWQDVSSS